jgi:hypothetical protein
MEVSLVEAQDLLVERLGIFFIRVFQIKTLDVVR